MITSADLKLEKPRAGVRARGALLAVLGIGLILLGYRRRWLFRLLQAIDHLHFAFARRPAPDLTWIAEDLAIGGRVHPREWERLAGAGIGAVVDCRAEGRDPHAVLARHGIRFLHLPTPDCGDFTAEQVVEGVEWVEGQIAEGRRVLVHCRAGKGRSVQIAAAVLGRRGLAPDDALARIRAQRPIVTPTPGQIARLRAFVAGA